MPGKQRDSKRKELERHLARAEQGDEKSLAVVRELFNAKPSLWEQAGNLAIQAERLMVSLAVGDNALYQEGLHRTRRHGR